MLCLKLRLKRLLADNRCEFFHPAVVRYAIRLTIAAVCNWSLPEINLIEVVETIELAPIGGQQFTGVTTSRHSRVGTKPGRNVTLNLRIKRVLKPQISALGMRRFGGH